MTLQTVMQVRTGREGVLSRRTFLRNVSAGAASLGLLGWKEAVTARAAEIRKQGMSCILLFMRGGPSQFETLDPKPGTANGGPTKAITTAASGIQLAEHWTNVAKVMKDVALVRSLTSKEGEHLRAAYQMHTGYVPSSSVKYPSIGAIAAAEIGRKDFDLPHFVSIGGNRFARDVGSGFLGMEAAPFVVNNPTQMPSNAELPAGIDDKRFAKRLDLLNDLESDFAEAGGGPRVTAHKALYTSASQMVLSPRLKAFDLKQESEKSQERYGKNAFGQGCLLARRLVEAGVTFVEVELNGWDTHADNFDRVKTLSGTCDPAFAALVSDLKERGMLDRTLVIWMGEFGRTPRINPNTGRDHYPRAFSVALAGGGVKGGQVVGATNDSGTEVSHRPVAVHDLFCTFYHALKVNPQKENMSSLGRPIKIVDGGKTVKELFSPHGKTLASAGLDEAIRVWDLATGQVCSTFSGDADRVLSLAFSPDGGTLASAGADQTIKIWAIAAPRPTEPAPVLAAKERDLLWTTLADQDAAEAYRAMNVLTRTPREVVALVKERLPPVPKEKAEKIQRLINALDDDSFGVREKAQEELISLGDGAAPLLRARLTGPLPSLEIKRRLERLVAGFGPSSPDALRTIRVVELLERMGDAEATQMLEALAKGGAGFLVTTEARDSADRLRKRAVRKQRP